LAIGLPTSSSRSLNRRSSSPWRSGPHLRTIGDLEWSTVERLEHEDDLEALALIAADKLDNIRAPADSISRIGEDKTWALFNANRADQQWYYRRISEILLLSFPENPLFRTLDRETREVFPDEDE
jgi:hypothetical protein